MKVKLQYTVDMDDIPEEVARLLDKAVSYSRLSSKDLADAASEFENKQTPEEFYIKLSEARDKMVHADLLISDCLAIVASYNSALANSLVEKINNHENQESIEE